MTHLAPTLLAFFTPKSGGSSNADQINSLYKITLVIALIIFFAVEGALGYALWKYRARKGRVPHQTHGNTRLEVGWTLAAAVILVGLAVVTFAKLSSIQDPPNSSAGSEQLGAENKLLYASDERKLPPNGKSLNITVIGRQYIWQYIYPGANERDGLGAPYSYEEMVVPTETTTVTLDIVSSDVVHSWWIPELGGKFHGRARATTTTRGSRSQSPASIAASAPLLCGRGHARMIADRQGAWRRHSSKRGSRIRRSRSPKPTSRCAGRARAKLNKQTGAGQVENP